MKKENGRKKQKERADKGLKGFKKGCMMNRFLK